MLKNVEYHPHGGLWVVQNRMLLLDGIINNSHNQPLKIRPPIPSPIPKPIPSTHPFLRPFLRPSLNPFLNTLKIPPSKAWCRLHRANATSPPAQRIASQPVRSASARASPVHHSAPRECNQPARIASHRKQSAHRAARRPHL